MSLPEVPYQERDGQRLIAQFGGINYRASAQENEYAEARNVSTEFWPRLSPRGRRSVQGTYGSPTALFAWDKLVIVDGTDLLYDGEVVAQVTPGEKQFAVVNTKLIVWPDGIWIDLVNGTSHSLSGRTTYTGATFTEHGVEFDAAPEGESMTLSGFHPAANTGLSTRFYDTLSYEGGEWVKGDNQDYQYTSGNAWMVGKYMIPRKTAAGAYAVNRFAVSGGSYDETAENMDGVFWRVTAASRREEPDGHEWELTLSVLNAASGLAGVFHAGDYVTISGCEEEANNVKRAKVTAVTENTLTFDATFTPGTETGDITVERDIPPFDFICASKNRLWGVCNAQTGERWNPDTGAWETVSSRVICGSELGEPTRFWTFEGLATDSWQTAVSSAEDFTGIIGYSDDVLAFKEHKIYRLAGDIPSEYYLYDWDMAGVQTGCHKSLQVINEVLYYKARNGVCAFTGTAPQYISYPLGTDHYFAAVAGSDKLNYYVSMEDEKGVRKLYVYDTTHGIWSVEDAERVTDFAWAGGKLYLLIGRNIYISETPTLAIEARTYTVPEGGLAAGDYKAVLGAERGFTLAEALAEGTVLRWTKTPENVYSEPETGFVSGKLYAVSGETVTEIPLTDPDDEATELTFTNADYTVTADPVEWSATFRQWDEDILERKDYRWLRLRFRLEEGSAMTVSGAPDHGELQELATYTEAGEHVTEIPLLPMRGDCFTVRIDGTGECAVKALRRDFMVGSDKV